MDASIPFSAQIRGLDRAEAVSVATRALCRDGVIVGIPAVLIVALWPAAAVWLALELRGAFLLLAVLIPVLFGLALTWILVRDARRTTVLVAYLKRASPTASEYGHEA